MTDLGSYIISKKIVYLQRNCIHDCITLYIYIYISKNHNVMSESLFKKGIKDAVFIMLMIAPKF